MSAPERKHATRPDEGHEWELPWLRGYEAGVIDMRAERDALAARLRTWRDARIAAMNDVNPETFRALADAEAGLVAALAETQEGAR